MESCKGCLAELTPTPSLTNKVLHGKVHLTVKEAWMTTFAREHEENWGMNGSPLGRPVDRRNQSFGYHHVFVGYGGCSNG